MAKELTAGFSYYDFIPPHNPRRSGKKRLIRYRPPGRPWRRGDYRPVPDSVTFDGR